MRVVFVVALVVVLVAAFVSVRNAVQPGQLPQLLATMALILAAGIQRIGVVQRYIDAPRRTRAEKVRAFVYDQFLELCQSQPVSDDMDSLRIHVWEVPLWYRKVFPYRLRVYAKRLVKLRPLRYFAKWSIRPSLTRLAAVGITERSPTPDITFKKGIGIVGLCIAHNNDSKVLSLNVSRNPYAAALKCSDEGEWVTKVSAEVRRGLTLEQARRLAGRYGQVVTRVIQDRKTGEAIACVSISVRSSRVPWLQVADKRLNERYLHKLKGMAGTIAEMIA